MKRNSNVKHSIYRTYGWWILLGIALFIVLGVYHESSSVWGVVVPGVGALLSSAYFIQKQKIEEAELFISLFEKFNTRYQELNEELEKIANYSGDEELTSEEKATLVAYFNMCGEEFMMFESGFIFPKAWNSWFRGMRHYLGKRRIKEFWETENKEESYYGLDRILP